MVWPAFFFSFLISRLYLLNPWFALGGVPLVASLYWFFLRKDNYSALRSGFVLLALAAGPAYSGFLERNIVTPDLTYQGNISQTGKIFQKSARSVVMEYSTKEGKFARIRITGLKKNHILQKGDTIQFSCETRVYKHYSTFQFLEKNQKILSPCQLLTWNILAKDQSYLSQFRSWLANLLEKRMLVFGANSLAPGFLLGDTDDLPAYRVEMFRKMGIAHLFAASGLHLGLLFAVFYIPFSRTPVRKSGTVIAFIACLAFLILLNFPVSLLRAFLFLSLHLFFKMIDRKISGMMVLFITAVIIELAYPLSTFTPAFILSFGVTASIILLFGPIKEILRFKYSLLEDNFALSFSAFSASMFLSWILFSNANPLSFIYNFLLVPVSGLYLALVILAIVYQPAAYLAGLAENIFTFPADMHLRYWDTFFPVQNSLYCQIYLIFFMAFLFYTGFYLAKEQHWKARYRFLRIFPLFIVSAPLLFTGIHAPDKSYKLFPYGAIVYETEKLNYYGIPAKFLNQEDSSWYERPCAPVKEILNYSAFSTAEIQKNSGMKNITTANRIMEKYGILKTESYCFVFFSRMKPEYWTLSQLADCSEIHLVLSKRDTVRGTNWIRFFSSFGFKGKEIVYDSYFTNTMRGSGTCQ